MKLRCKDGDLAIIVGDFPGCEENLGVIVKVVGPTVWMSKVQLTCWHVYPVSRRKLWTIEPLEKEWVSKTNTVFHPDCMLMPIAGGSNSVTAQQKVKDSHPA